VRKPDQTATCVLDRRLVLEFVVGVVSPPSPGRMKYLERNRESILPVRRSSMFGD
jgi:hypothetical protein